jgi:transglutaminase-like putative cysteine protease
VTVAEVAVHGGRGRRPGGRSRLAEVGGMERPLLRLVSFAALAGYGVLRWATLETPAQGGRLVGLLALAVAVAAIGPWLDRRSRPLAIVGLVLAFGAMLTLAGIPFSWLTHARVAIISQLIGQGLTALPDSVVPYDGIDSSLRLVILLGAGVLLLDGAVMIAFAPRTLGDLRRGAAALPLVALAVVPATLVRPQLPYLQGVILFALVAAFVWGERVVPRRGLGAAGVVGLAGVAGMVIGPVLEQHHAWINPRGLAGSLTPVHVDAFDWTQRYGPFSWPRDNRTVFEVKAAQGDYWKTENLDAFTAVGWAQGRGASALPPPAPSATRRFTHTITVTIRGMSSAQVIGEGSSSPPTHLDQSVFEGVSPGTWTVETPLGPGDSYTVKSYSPRPSPAELRADRGPYPDRALAAELTIGLPVNGLQFGGPLEVTFPVFHSGSGVVNVIGPTGVSGRELVERSPYGHAYTLADELARGAATQYVFALAVERFLSPANGFVYDEHPPASRFPLESFLFGSRHGYCQQFAGAMALLLRMGGVPARVATGFTTGDYDGATNQYVVSDLDAHAWVEAWFPRYGWVRFDPTPVSAPARTGTGLLPALRGGPARRARRGSRRNIVDAGAGAPVAGHHGSGGGVPLALLPVAALALLIGLAFTARTLLRPAPSSEQLVAELERALARAGRPLGSGVTLHALEQRFGGSSEAAVYVRTLRLARFAGDPRLPPASQRRALRAQLAAGLGVVGRLRAWWALPPRGLH